MIASLGANLLGAVRSAAALRTSPRVVEPHVTAPGVSEPILLLSDKALCFDDAITKRVARRVEVDAAHRAPRCLDEERHRVEFHFSARLVDQLDGACRHCRYSSKIVLMV